MFKMAEYCPKNKFNVNAIEFGGVNTYAVGRIIESLIDSDFTNLVEYEVVKHNLIKLSLMQGKSVEIEELKYGNYLCVTHNGIVKVIPKSEFKKIYVLLNK